MEDYWVWPRSLKLWKRTEDHAQQVREEAVAGHVVHVPNQCKDHQNKLCPSWESIYAP
jgi:hypothetical protein